MPAGGARGHDLSHPQDQGLAHHEGVVHVIHVPSLVNCVSHVCLLHGSVHHPMHAWSKAHIAL